MTQPQEEAIAYSNRINNLDFDSISPYNYYLELQAQSPLTKVKNYGWIVTGYPELVDVLKDNRFGAYPPVQAALQPLLEKRHPITRKILAPPLRLVLQRNKFVNLTKNWLIFTNPPDHTRLRKIANAAFTPKVIKALKPRIAQITKELLDEIDPTKEFDLIEAFSYPLPIIVITEMLGIPNEDRDQFKQWSQAIIAGFSQSTQDLSAAQRALQAQEQAVKFLRDVIAIKGHSGQDDIITQLIQAREVEGKMTDDELIANLILFLIAGHETTVNLITNTVHALVTHQDQFEKLKKQPELVGNTIEESLRFDPPVTNIIRVARESFSFHGRQIKKGEFIELSLFAANRDARQFSDPEKFDITRGNARQHLSFGKSIHVCVGAPLARAEAELAFTELFSRFPNLRLADNFIPKRRKSFAFSTFASLKLRVD